VRVTQVRAKNEAGWSPFSQPPLTENTSGKLSAAGLNAHGQLGGGFERHAGQSLIEVSSMLQYRVDMLACGGGHSGALCDGAVFTWGRNDAGQLGRLAGFHDPDPGQVEVRGYMSVQTGSAVASRNNELFKYSNLAILRQDGPSDYLGSLGPMDKTKGHCVGLAMGDRHTLILTSEGEIFGFGDGDFGVLGQGDVASYPVPRLVDYLLNRGMHVDSVFCGALPPPCQRPPPPAPVCAPPNLPAPCAPHLQGPPLPLPVLTGQVSSLPPY